jgi:hypothetical protein
MGNGEVMYPCLYGIRPVCEALTLMLKPNVKVFREPESDDEKVMKKFFEAYFKYLPTQILLNVKDIAYAMNLACDHCPHRIAEVDARIRENKRVARRTKAKNV